MRSQLLPFFSFQHLTLIASCGLVTGCVAGGATFPDEEEEDPTAGDGDGDGPSTGGTGGNGTGGTVVVVTGGNANATGGASSSGGASTGGTDATGGSTATGGSSAGGNATGGSPATGGSAPDCTGVTCDGDGTGTCDDSGGSLSCTCDSGYQDNDGDLTCNDACSEGTCTGNNEECDDSSGAALCACTAGYTGENCDACDTAAGYEDIGGGVCERPPCTVPGTYDFIDDFEQGAACWTSQSGTWAVAAGGGSESSDGYEQSNGTGANISTAAPGPYTFVRVEAKMKVTAWGADPGASWAGVFARYSGTDDWYGALINGEEDGRVYQGSSTYRGSTQNAPTIVLGQWYDIALELRDLNGDGSRVELVWEFEGTSGVVGDYSDNSIDPGSIGVGTLGGAQAVFDDVEVTVLD